MTESLEISLLHAIERRATPGWYLDRQNLDLRRDTADGHIGLGLDILDYAPRFDVRPLAFVVHFPIEKVDYRTANVYKEEGDEREISECPRTVWFDLWEVPGAKLKAKIITHFKGNTSKPSIDKVAEIIAADLFGPVEAFLLKCSTVQGIDWVLNRNEQVRANYPALLRCRKGLIAAWMLGAKDYAILREKYRAEFFKKESFERARACFDALLKDLETLPRPAMARS
jgi:hypothetical protein